MNKRLRSGHLEEDSLCGPETHDIKPFGRQNCDFVLEENKIGGVRKAKFFI